MTKLKEIVSQAPIAAAIIAKPDGSEFCLLGLETPTPEATQLLTTNGYVIAGVLGIVSGQMRSALTMPIEAKAMTMLSNAFVAHANGALKESSRSAVCDSAAWLEDLYKLEDPRR